MFLLLLLVQVVALALPGCHQGSALSVFRADWVVGLMPCCRCQTGRACTRCSCVKAGRVCSDCYPSRSTPSTCCNVSAAAAGVLRSQPPSIASAGVDPALSCGVDGASLQSRPPVVHSVSRDLAPPLTVASAFDASVISSQEGDGGSSENASGSSENGEEGDECSPHLVTVNRSATLPSGPGEDTRLLADLGGSQPSSVLDSSEDYGMNTEHRAGGGQVDVESTAQARSRPIPSPADAGSGVASVARDPFSARIIDAYEVVVGWRRNLFIIPHGSAGAAFVDELASLILGFADDSGKRDVAWRAVCVACHLLLQKPHKSKIMKNHSEHLRRRLVLWRDCDIPQLLSECLCIQAHLPASGGGSPRPASQEKSDVVFANLVFNGKISSAVRYLAPNASGGVLSMNDIVDDTTGETVRDALLKKHPPSVTPPASALLPGDPEIVNQVIFQQITPELIKKIGRGMQGSSGPSGLDAEAWCRMLTCYDASSRRLCSSLAAAGRCICTERLAGCAMIGFTSARLIPLDKKPGVRPIAVGEVYRRIIGRAVMSVVESDVLSVTAPVQLCVGVPSACEAAVHTMSRLFAGPGVEGVLLVDASNAFNALNRQAALHNIPRLCPPLATVFRNTYGSVSRLFVSGGGEIESREGTAQGDPLAMAAYAVAIMPLVRRLAATCPSVVQSWFADDDSGAGLLARLRNYWDELRAIGPGYGYYPNASKTVLITKPEHLDRAREIFFDSGIQITAAGGRFLGGALGSEDFCRSYMGQLADRWAGDLRTLCEIAQTQPHAAYTVFSKALSSRWTYHLRSMPFSTGVLEALDEILSDHFLPALLGHGIAQASHQRRLMALPVRHGGLAAAGEHQAF
eukprot:scpid42091/ scgid2002/ 